MESNYNLEIIAYHGTEREAAEKIKQDKIFSSRYRDNHWLGQGIYFFREDFKQAEFWGNNTSENRIKYKKVQEAQTVVIRGILNVARKNFWNLDSRDDLEKFQDHLLTELLELESEGLEIEVDHDHKEADKLRCYFCDLISNAVYLIQRTFKGKSIFDKDEWLMSMGLGLHGAQLCVRESKIIDTESLEYSYLGKFSIDSIQKGKKSKRHMKRINFE